MKKTDRVALRERVGQAILASAGIFGLALAFWGVQTFQSSQADIIGSPYQVSPTSGQAPLLVTARYLNDAVIPPPSSATVTFDDQLDGQVITTEYEASHGVRFSSSQGSVHTRVNNAGCTGTGTEASSPPNFLTGQDSNSLSPITATLTQATRSLSFQLVSAGANTYTTTFFGADGTSVASVTTPGRPDPVNGACNKDTITYSGAVPVTSLTVEITTLASTADGFGIDDLSFEQGLGPVIPAWNFGDGTGFVDGEVAEHTYPQPGTYDVSIRLGETVTPNVASVVVTNQVTMTVSPTSGEAPLTVTATHTNAGQAAGIDDSRIWDFGDGAVLADAGATVTHTYRQAGTYTLTLSAGGSQASATITVTEPAKNTAVTALGVSKSVYELRETVRFTLKSDGPADITLPSGAPFVIAKDGSPIFSPIATQALEPLRAGDARTWTWDQRDNNEQFVAAGAYTVAVTYRLGTESVTKSTSFTIAPAPPPPPDAGTFTVAPTSGRVPLLVHAAYTGTKANLVLDFGDGAIFTKPQGPGELDHTYERAGAYTVTLRAGAELLGTVEVSVQPALESSQTVGGGTTGGTQASTATGTSSGTSASGASTAATTTSGTANSQAATSATVLASTGSSLALTLLIALALSGLIGYFMIRRPFHGS